jgi:hypothetical protein
MIYLKCDKFPHHPTSVGAPFACGDIDRRSWCGDANTFGGSDTSTQLKNGNRIIICDQFDRAGAPLQNFRVNPGTALSKFPFSVFVHAEFSLLNCGGPFSTSLSREGAESVLVWRVLPPPPTPPGACGWSRGGQSSAIATG